MSISVAKVPVLRSTNKYVYISYITIGVYTTALFALLWFWPGNIPHNFGGWQHIFDYIIFLSLTYVVWQQILMELFSWFVGLKMTRPLSLPPEENLRVAFLTAFVPGNEPVNILENTLKAMIEVDYPHDTWVLDEGNSAEVRRVCRMYGVRHFTRYSIDFYNQDKGKYKAKTKGGNYNAWFDNHGKKYDLVAQIDVDFIPKKNFLMDTIGYFRDPKVAFVGTPQVYGNQHISWIARGAAEQAFSFYGHMQKGLCGFDMSLFIGANHIVRASAHADIDGYSGHIVEDHLTGMNIYKKGWKSVYVPKILAVGEGPATWEAYFSQQMRWAYGLIHIFMHESFRLFPGMKRSHIFNYFLLQQFYFYGIAQFIGVILLSLYFIFGIRATNLDLASLITVYVPLLIMQLLITIWLQNYTIDPESESGFLGRGRLLSLAAWPIYLLAYLSVLTGKKLTYKVTPKGDSPNDSTTPLRLFLPHIILGSVTAVDIIVGFMTNHTSPQLLLFAVLNTVFMYLFVAMVIREKLLVFVRESVNLSQFGPRVLLQK